MICLFYNVSYTDINGIKRYWFGNAFPYISAKLVLVRSLCQKWLLKSWNSSGARRCAV